jgi:hypothetical protein
MTRLWCNSFADRSRRAFAIALVLAAPAAWAQTPARQAAAAPPAAVESLLVQATKAEADMRLSIAIDRLYELLIEHPGTGDALAARLRLARLLALSGSTPQAMLECQLLRDELPADHPLRTEALELSSVLARRLRAGMTAGQPYFAVFEAVPSRGVQALDEPRAMAFEGVGRFVLLDEGAGRVYRVGTETAAQIAAPPEPSAVAVLPDGTLVLAGKTGLVTVPATRTVLLSGTWGGKVRQAKKVRSMAALADGSLLVIDKDYEGLLRCQIAAGTCAPWGPIGKYRVVRVDVSDWVYLLDDRGQSVRILDPSQRQITLLGPMAGPTKLERVEDIAVDAAHGVYLLDSDLRRIHVFHLKTSPDGRIGAALAASLVIPQEGPNALKNPIAIGVDPSGQVFVAGKSSPRMMRYR